MKPARPILYVLLGLLILWAAYGRFRWTLIRGEQDAVRAAIASDPALRQLQYDVDNRVDGPVASEEIRDRFYKLLDKAGAKSVARNVWIAPSVVHAGDSVIEKSP